MAKKKEVVVTSDLVHRELSHYYCHECDTHHEKGSPIWNEHHPKLRKLKEGVKGPNSEPNE